MPWFSNRIRLVRDLKVGECYYTFGIFPYDFIIPVMHAYIYLGKNIFPQEINKKKSVYYFQETNYYIKGIKAKSVSDCPVAGILQIDRENLDCLCVFTRFLAQVVQLKQNFYKDNLKKHFK